MRQKVDKSTLSNMEFKAPTVLTKSRQCCKDNYCWLKLYAWMAKQENMDESFISDKRVSCLITDFFVAQGIFERKKFRWCKDKLHCWRRCSSVSVDPQLHWRKDFILMESCDQGETRSVMRWWMDLTRVIGKYCVCCHGKSGWCGF